MRMLTVTGSLFLLACSALLAGGLPTNTARGTYVEARTADVYTGPCFANGEAGLTGDLAVFGWKIEKGVWNGVKLDGLGVVGIVKASATLGNVVENPYPVKSVLILDENADAQQRLALKGFAQRMAGDLLQDIVRLDYAPISLDVENGNVHGATATLQAGELAKIRTRALADGDQICHNEEVWYLPLTKVGHAMPAYTLANAYRGKGLGIIWSAPYQRSAYVADFHLDD